MPTPVYYFQLRSTAGHGNTRCLDKQEADSLYLKVAEAISANADFVELKHDNEASAIRVSGINGFGVICQMEPTQEEIEKQHEEAIRAQAKCNTINQASPAFSTGRLLGY